MGKVLQRGDGWQAKTADVRTPRVKQIRSKPTYKCKRKDVGVERKNFYSRLSLSELVPAVM